MSSPLLYTWIQNPESHLKHPQSFKKKMNFKDLGVPQGSILDPLSFHLDLFCFGNVIRTCDISGFFLGNDDW